VIGTYGIALVHADVPDFMIGARRGSPLVLGVGKSENFLASDVSAIVAYTRDAVYLNDFDVVALERDKFEISSLAGESGDHRVSKVEFTAEDIKKGDYANYMLKPTSETFFERSAEWVRDGVPFGNWIIDTAEHYTASAPRKGGPALKRLPSVGLSPVRPLVKHAKHVTYTPSPIKPVFATPLPGEGVWRMRLRRPAARLWPPRPASDRACG